MNLRTLLTLSLSLVATGARAQVPTPAVPPAAAPAAVQPAATPPADVRPALAAPAPAKAEAAPAAGADAAKAEAAPAVDARPAAAPAPEAKPALATPTPAPEAKPAVAAPAPAKAEAAPAVDATPAAAAAPAPEAKPAAAAPVPEAKPAVAAPAPAKVQPASPAAAVKPAPAPKAEAKPAASPAAPAKARTADGRPLKHAAIQPAKPDAIQEFGAEAKLFYRAVACAGDAPLPAHLDAAVVAEHCKALAPKVAKYQQTSVGTARSFIANLRPKQLPTRVVYPFGGGDLAAALTTYPDAVEYTTMSLEHAGDPRRLNDITKGHLDESLALLRRTIWGLLMAHNSTTENLQKGQRGEIPGQLAFFLVAIAAHGYEPVSLRYFTLNPDGTVHYLTAGEIAAHEDNLAKTLRGQWASPDISVAFSNMELTFRTMGAGPDAPLKVHRHFAANLGDQAMVQDPSLLKHLEAKGRVVALTKAASYLLWRDDFAKVRDYLLSHMEFMVSDSTGVPPRFAKAAGFELETYGSFTGSFLPASAALNQDFRALWQSQPRRELGFRYGYLDAGGSFHMMVARKSTPEAK